MATNKLDQEELDAALKHLDGWRVNDGKLHRQFEFPDFIHAFGFMTTAAFSIEKANHHPEWLNVYNRVTVDLITHDVGGITQKDVDLAHLLNSIAAKLA